MSLKEANLITNLIPWRKVLILLAGIPLLTVQQKEVDHLLLVVTRMKKLEKLEDVI